MGDAQPFERGGGVGQHGIDADAQFVGAFLRFAAEIDRDNAELGALGRDRAHQPDFAVVGGHLGAGRRRHGGRGGLDHLGEHLLGHRDAGAPSAAGGGLARAGEQHDLALHDCGEMILDRGMDVAHVEGDRQAAREGVEIAHVDLALARQFQLPLQAGGELAHHHRDEDEQEEVEDLVRVLDAQAVERRIEEEGGGAHAADGGDHRRDDAPARGRDHHWDQVDDRAVVQPGLDDRA